MKMRRICVFGAGAIGGHLAAKFAAAGHDVAVVARGANLAAIQSNGVALREGAGADARTIAGRVRASDRPSDLGAQDVVFVTTKATALAGIAPVVSALCDPGTAFVFVQNGIPWWYAMGIDSGPHRARPRPPDLSRLDPRGALASAIAAGRVIGAAVYSSNDVAEPGVVLNHTWGRDMLVVGEIDDRPTERIAALRARLLAGGEAIARAAGVAAPTLEAVHAVTARLAARKGLYSPP